MDNELLHIKYELEHLRLVNELLSDELFLLRAERESFLLPKVKPKKYKTDIESNTDGNFCCRRFKSTKNTPKTQLVSPVTDIEPSEGGGGLIHRRRKPENQLGKNESGIEPSKGGNPGPNHGLLGCRRKCFDVDKPESQSEGKADDIKSSKRDESGWSGNLESLHIGKTRAVTAATPKSTTGLVYNFLEHVDIGIGFVYRIGHKLKLSKGAKTVLKCKYVSNDTWTGMSVVSDTPKCQVRIHADLPLLLMRINTENTEVGAISASLNQLLRMLNYEIANEFPIRLGIDDYREIREFSPILLLKEIEANSNLFFYFYTYGLRDLTFLEIDGKGTQGQIPGNNADLNYRNSMIEIRNIIANEDKRITKEYKDIMHNALYGIKKESVWNKIKLKGFQIFSNNDNRIFFPKSSLEDHAFAFSIENGGQFVPYVNKASKYQSEEEFLLLTKKTKIRLNNMILANIGAIKICEVPFPEIDFITGVPGCGKTHFIINNHQVGTDLILTLTKEGCHSIRSAVEAQSGISKDTLIQNYRTVASLLVNGSTKKFGTVYIDEALLMHAGLVGYIVALTSADRIILVGDEWQIPFIDRERISSGAFCSPTNFAHVTTTLACTRRCPLDVTYALSDYYTGIYSSSSVVLSMSLCKVSDETLTDLPNTLYLTHTQEDKEALISLGLGGLPGSKTLTIHEAQGQTYQHVRLIRFNRAPIDLYNSIEHAIVAISRHTISFKYVTQAGDDIVTALMRKVGTVEGDLQAWNEAQKIRQNLGLHDDKIIRRRNKRTND